jgi:hypothetical protein
VATHIPCLIYILPAFPAHSRPHTSAAHYTRPRI